MKKILVISVIIIFLGLFGFGLITGMTFNPTSSPFDNNDLIPGAVDDLESGLDYVNPWGNLPCKNIVISNTTPAADSTINIKADLHDSDGINYTYIRFSIGEKNLTNYINMGKLFNTKKIEGNEGQNANPFQEISPIEIFYHEEYPYYWYNKYYSPTNTEGKKLTDIKIDADINLVENLDFDNKIISKIFSGTEFNLEISFIDNKNNTITCSARKMEIIPPENGAFYSTHTRQDISSRKLDRDDKNLETIEISKIGDNEKWLINKKEIQEGQVVQELYNSFVFTFTSVEESKNVKFDISQNAGDIDDIDYSTDSFPEFSEDISEPSKNIFYYIGIEKENIEVDDLNLYFPLDQEWLTDADIEADEVNIYRHDKGWEMLDGLDMDKSVTPHIYKTKSPGLSTFAVGGDPICDGELNITLEPKSVTPDKKVTANVSGLEDCENNLVRINLDSCNGEGYCIVDKEGECGYEFTAPSDSGEYTYHACVMGMEEEVKLLVKTECDEDDKPDDEWTECSKEKTQTMDIHICNETTGDWMIDETDEQDCCLGNSDCGDLKICENEQCEDVTCKVDGDCDDYEKCIKYECEKTEIVCTKDNDCNKNERCEDEECIQITREYIESLISNIESSIKSKEDEYDLSLAKIKLDEVKKAFENDDYRSALSSVGETEKAIENATKKGGEFPWLWIIVAVLFIVLLFALKFFLFKGKPTKKKVVSKKDTNIIGRIGNGVTDIIKGSSPTKKKEPPKKDKDIIEELEKSITNKK